jgi:hypothetical protein
MQTTIVSTLLLLLAGEPAKLANYTGDWSKMAPITPKGYICYRAAGPMTIDGNPDEKSWADAPWTDDFADIEGPRKAKPRFRTRAKMLWDDNYLYVFAELEEPHVWGTLAKKNDIIFYDPDFEVFIDPDGDNHHYYEFEMNALNTIWELTLDKPYMDGGPAKLGTNLPGLKSAVAIHGTLNNPADTDKGWSVEIAFPFKDLATYADAIPCPPTDGDQWRLGFSRVEWLIDIIDNKYRKVPREAHAEDNWVWSPQGIVNMHRPERWGYVQFSKAAPGSAQFKPDATLPARDLLMNVYHRQRAFKEQFGKYADNLESLGLKDATHASLIEPLRLEAREKGYLVTVKIKLADGTIWVLHTQEDSRIWREK